MSKIRLWIAARTPQGLTPQLHHPCLDKRQHGQKKSSVSEYGSLARLASIVAESTVGVLLTSPLAHP